MMFEAIDTVTKHSPFSLAWSTKPNAMTLLPLPVLEVLDFENDEIAKGYTSRLSIRESKVQDFFHIDPSSTSALQLKPRSGCQRPNIRNQLERGLHGGNIKLKCFVDTRNIETRLDLKPFVAMLKHQERPLLQILNKALRHILLDINNLDIGRKFNKNINKAQ
ncbi:uncharacterized protein ATC70_003021 [Mucor velutinosus]|uniref:Uncharacterized protein n=1 Tax=Mucor velutinosus TaxID=708070 RepID=A0AAN7D8T9_9FUNG|nr:hypothetical protein ATC70_003021 [Mucor velutinosus]